MNIVQTLIGLPDDAKSLIAVLVTAAVIWLVQWIASKTSIDLSGYADAVIALVAGLIVAVLEKYLALVPGEFDNLVLAIIHVLVLALGGGMLFVIAKRRTVRGMLAK